MGLSQKLDVTEHILEKKTMKRDGSSMKKNMKK